MARIVARRSYRGNRNLTAGNIVAASPSSRPSPRKREEGQGEGALGRYTSARQARSMRAQASRNSSFEVA